MEITLSTLLSFLSNYLLAATICFVGCFTKEAYKAMKSTEKISLKRIALGGIAGAFMSCCIYRLLVSHFSRTVEFELYMGICFGVGWFSNAILDFISNRTMIIKFAQSILSKSGDTGKALSDAWKKAEDEDNKKKEKEEDAKSSNSKSSKDTKKNTTSKSSKSSSKSVSKNTGQSQKKRTNSGSSTTTKKKSTKSTTKEEKD